MLEIERKSGRRYYIVPIVITFAAAFILLFMASLAENPQETVAALAIQCAVLFVVSTITLAIACWWWIGIDSVIQTALGLVATAAATLLCFYIINTWVPLAGMGRVLIFVICHGLILARLADIDWQEGMLLAMFNVILWVVAILAL